MGRVPTRAEVHDAMMASVPDACLDIMCRLSEGGYEAYAVGGCVRDVVIGRQPHDWDLATSATPDEMKLALPGLRSIDTGLAHGTVTFEAGGGLYEVTTFRSDGDYSDGRHPDSVEFASTVLEDLSRRDFTMNAMAWNWEGLVDPHGGLRDASDGLVRCVGSPAARFSEDSLRVLRAVRFAAVLGFDLEPSTQAAANAMADGLSRVSGERIRSELLGTFGVANGTHLAKVLDANREVLFEAFGAPELRRMVGYDQMSVYHDLDLWEHTLHVVAGVQGAHDMPMARIAALFHDVAKPAVATVGADGHRHFRGHPEASADVARRALAARRFSRAETDRAAFLVREHDKRPSPTVRSCRKMAVRCGGDAGLVDDLFALMRSDVAAHDPKWVGAALNDLTSAQMLSLKLRDAEHLFSVRDLAIDGHDLMDAGFAQGPELGACLKGMFADVIAGKVENDREELLQRARQEAAGMRGAEMAL